MSKCYNVLCSRLSDYTAIFLSWCVFFFSQKWFPMKFERCWLSTSTLTAIVLFFSFSLVPFGRTNDTKINKFPSWLRSVRNYWWTGKFVVASRLLSLVVNLTWTIFCSIILNECALLPKVPRNDHLFHEKRIYLRDFFSFMIWRVLCRCKSIRIQFNRFRIRSKNRRGNASYKIPHRFIKFFIAYGFYFIHRDPR